MAKRYTQAFSSYFRGILQRKAPRARDPGYVDEALNVAFIGGAIQGRPGMRPFNGVAFSGPIRGHGWHVAADGSRELLVAAGANLQRCVLGGDPIDMPLTGVPSEGGANVRVDVQKVNFLSLSGGANVTFIYDGVNANLKWDGTNLSKMGVPGGSGDNNGIGKSPTPAVPTPAAGLITAGVRIYVQTLISGASGHEGDCGDQLTQSRTVTATGNQQFTFASPVQFPLTPNPVLNQFDDPQVTKWRLYRTVAAGAELRFIGEANITVSITDNVTDLVLAGENLVEQLVNGQPQAPIAALAEHRGQLVAAMSDDLSLLRFSNFDPDYMVPEGWPRNYVQPVAHGDGDTITALKSFTESCVVFKNNSTYAVVGDTFSEYTVQPLLAGGSRIGIGCGFPGSILQIENAMFFAARDGIYRLDRFASAYGGRGLEAARMTAAIDDLYAAANFSLGSATFFDRKKRVFAFLSHGVFALMLLHH